MKNYFALRRWMIGIFFSMTALSQAIETPLYKYVLNTDDHYGYDDNQPVPLNYLNTEFISVPVNYTPSKRQFRSAWVASISNLNMPKASDEADFKKKYTTILDTFSQWHMNAMIFQVRPLLDAYYLSDINPWSEFIAGQAQGTNPGYDPLPWIIEETHARGMEFHAWFNPYRVTNTRISALSPALLARISENIPELNALDANEIKIALSAMSIPELINAFHQGNILADNNFAVLHPEEVLIFDEKLFLNPASPQVRQHVIDTITEVITKYKVDAIHFDDYFYPYKINGKIFGSEKEDYASFQTYGMGHFPDNNDGIEAWRRHNINLLINGIKTAIDNHNQQHKTAVQFGISPFGIWEHAVINPLGSHTPTGSSKSYSESIFADTLKWIKEEHLDYVIPQIYWSFDQRAAPYGELTNWWSNAINGTRVQLYIGHANYKHVNNGGWEQAWMNPEEIPNQLKYNQRVNNVSGSALFSYNDMLPSDLSKITPADQAKHTAKNDAINLLREQFFNVPALVPAKPWLDHTPTTAPFAAHFTDNAPNYPAFSWSDTPENDAHYYIIYYGIGDPYRIIADPKNILKRLWRGQSNTFQFVDTQIRSAEGHYIVTALDAAQNESEPTIVTTSSPETPIVPPNENNQEPNSKPEDNTGNNIDNPTKNPNTNAQPTPFYVQSGGGSMNILFLVYLLCLPLLRRFYSLWFSNTQ